MLFVAANYVTYASSYLSITEEAKVMWTYVYVLLFSCNFTC